MKLCTISYGIITYKFKRVFGLKLMNTKKYHLRGHVENITLKKTKRTDTFYKIEGQLLSLSIDFEMKSHTI